MCCSRPSAGATKASGVSLRDKAFVVVTCGAIVAQTSNYAIMVTFFPIDMRERGMSGLLISSIFAMFEVGRLVAGCIGGALASRFGRRSVLTAGMGCASLFGCIMGVIPDIVGEHDLAGVAALFIITRFLQGCGVSLAQVAIFAILSDAFPTRRGLVVGTATSMIAAGYFVGPPLGGFLYSIGSFRLPFFALGLLLAAFLPFIISLYPSQRTLVAVQARGTRDNGTVPASVEAAAASSEAPSPESAPGAPSPAGETAGEEPAGLASTWRWWEQHTRELPQDVWLLLFISLLYFSKWGWWDIWFTTWTTTELGFSLQAASISISFIAAMFAFASPISGWLGDRLTGGTRMLLILVCMHWFTLLHFFMGPWQVGSWGWNLPARRIIFFAYLACDGLPAALVEAQFLPQTLMLAEAAATGGPSEDLTNFLTSLSQTFTNLGQVLGPFAAVPIVEAYGFRGGLVAWGVAYLAVSLWGWCRVMRGGHGCVMTPRPGRDSSPTELAASGAAPSWVQMEGGTSRATARTALAPCNPPPAPRPAPQAKGAVGKVPGALAAIRRYKTLHEEPDA